MIRVHLMTMAAVVLATATFSTAADQQQNEKIHPTTNKILQSKILATHTAVPQPKPRSWFAGPHNQDEKPQNVIFWMNYPHSKHYLDMLELADYLAEQQDEKTGNPLYRVNIIADRSKETLIKETTLELRSVTVEQNLTLQATKDIFVIDSEYEASQLMESEDRPYILMQGFETPDLKLAYESPTYRNTLLFDAQEQWDYFKGLDQEPSIWETITNKFSETYRTIMIEDDKKFETARGNDRENSSSCPRVKAYKLKTMSDQIQYFIKFGTRHLQPVAQTRASLMQRHNLDIKFALTVLAFATLLLIWMLAATILSKFRYKSTSERILDESTDKKSQ